LAHLPAPAAVAAAIRRPTAQPLLWSALGTAALVLAVSGGGLHTELVHWLGDTDDAVRLVGVRELIAGAPWFDTTLPRIGAPTPLVSHWSRLIDLPLALLISALKPLFGAAGAEIATRVLWPAGLFFALLWAYSREVMRRAGPWGVALAVALVVACIWPMIQFRPGRVDHHNAQILCAVMGVLYLARCLEDERFGWPAGLLLGAGLAVGYEAILITVPALAVTTALALWRGGNLAGIAGAAAAFAGVLAAALAATQTPAQWLAVHCDALALNLVVLAAFAAAGIWAAMLLPQPSRALARLGIGGCAAALGAAAYAGLQPACLAGPFGEVDPALNRVWLDHVTETKSVLALGDGGLAPALALAAFFAAAIAVAAASWRRERSDATAVAAFVLALAAVLGCWQIKFLPYASWLAIFPLAGFAAGLDARYGLSAPVVRIACVTLLSLSTLTTSFEALEAGARAFVGARPHAPVQPEVTRSCTDTANLAGLATLAPGLVAANIDLGPYIVATTPHRVAAAPYHRLAADILALDTLFRAPPEKARGLLGGLGIDYVVLCTGAVRPDATGEGLRRRLERGESVDYLEAIPLPSETSLKAWRVLLARAPGAQASHSAGAVPVP
jgi:hypothetical protein